MDFVCAKHGRSKRTKIEENTPVDIITRLPRELIVEIFSRLPVSSLINFMYVCRAWRSLAQDPCIVKHLSSITQSNRCLIFHCDSPIRSELCCIDYTPGNIEKVTNFRPTFSDLMPEFDVVASCDGMLCLFDSLFGNKLYLYNPLTNCFKQLPKFVQYPNQEVVFGFGFIQKTKEFKVIQIVHDPRQDCPCSKVLVLTLGSSNWRDTGKVAYRFAQCNSEILVNGRLHWVTQPPKNERNRSSRLVSFDLADELFEEVSKPCCEALNKYEYHLLVIRGCLSAAFYCRRGSLEIWVMKHYGVKESWSKECSIRKHVPRGLKEKQWDWGLKFLKTLSRARDVKVLCLLNNGDILLEFKGKALATYEPTSKKFKDVKIQGTPKLFQVVHAGCFNWIDTLVHNRA